MKMTSSATLMMAAALAVIVTMVDAGLDYDRIHVVDRIGSNSFLFRGNQPVNQTSPGNYVFAYDTLVEYMAKRAKSQVNYTMPPPQKIYVVDITFENVDTDGASFTAEADFWKQKENAAKGTYAQWMLIGAIVWANPLSNATRDKMITDGTVWKTDKIPTRVMEMRRMLEAGPPKGYDALAIYVHCAAGCDRTGEFVAAYRMAHFYAGSLKPIYAEDVKECGRAPAYLSSGAIGWYCLTWNLLNSTAAQPPMTDCLTAYKCQLFKQCTATGL